MFIVFEGIDGAGKTTVLREVLAELEQIWDKVTSFREPGGGEEAEAIRHLIRDESKVFNIAAETLLYQAARAQLVQSVIQPHLDDGWHVLLDRYIYSTVAYQGAGNGVNLYMLNSFNQFSTGNLIPDLVFYLDISPEVSAARLKGSSDRYDQKPIEYFERVRKSYLDMAKGDSKSGRWRVIDAERPLREVVLGCLAHILLFKKEVTE